MSGVEDIFHSFLGQNRKKTDVYTVLIKTPHIQEPFGVQDNGWVLLTKKEHRFKNHIYSIRNYAQNAVSALSVLGSYESQFSTKINTAHLKPFS